MYKHLRLAALIVLFAFVGLPFVTLAHYGDGSHIHCSDCGAEPHMNPEDCKNNSNHGDDDDCPDCEGNGQLWPGCSHCGEVRAPSATEWGTGAATDAVPWGGSTILNGIYGLLSFGPWDSGPGSAMPGVSICDNCGDPYPNMFGSETGYHDYGYCSY